MNLDYYQKNVIPTWNYEVDVDQIDFSLLHAILGLAGEAAELGASFYNSKAAMPLWKAHIVDELGDILYYVVALTYVNGVSATEIVENIVLPMECSWEDYVIDLTTCTGQLAGEYNKVLYKNGYDECRFNEHMDDCIRQVFACVMGIGRVLGLTLEDISVKNRAKLAGGRHGWVEKENE